jgi:hypothetical protein
MDNPRVALRVGGTVFLFVAIAHFLRVFLKIRLEAAGVVLPFWGSVIGFLFALLLALWMFKAAKRT